MSQTKSYDYTDIRNYFFRDSCRLLSEVSSGSLASTSSDAEKYVSLGGVNIYLEKLSRIRTVSTNLEAWIRENKKPLEDLQKYLIDLMQQLSPQRTVEVEYADEAIIYCAEHQLIQSLAFAEDLIRKHFAKIDRIRSYVEYDPETNDKWVSIDIEVFGNIDQVIEWEENFTKEWVASVPYPFREKLRFSYDII
jgi:hypothetical protein